MGLYLTADDLRRYETASRALISPLANASIDAWRRDVNRAVRELMGGDRTIFMMPGGERLFFSEEDPDLAAGVEQYVTDYTADGIRLSDAVVDFWQKLRRQGRVDVFSWERNEQMIGRYGYAMKDSDMVSGVLQAKGIQDFVGCYSQINVGEILVWVLFDARDRVRFGEGSLAVLQSLLPSLHAGLDAVGRLDAQRRSLDLLTEALAVFGRDRVELHRNEALVRLVDADPEGETILAEVQLLARSLHPLAFPGRCIGVAPGLRRVDTRTASYELKGALLPPGSFGADPAVMVTVARLGAVTLPDARALRERFGLTDREGQVALLLAEGLSNAEIAERLYLSPHTARRHTANIFDKLGVNSRKGLALLFLRD